MVNLFLRKLAGAAILAWVVCTLAYFLMFAISGDPTAAILGSNPQESERAALRERLGLDRPIVLQYLEWITHALTGDLGHAWSGGQPVAELLMLRLPVTLSVVAGATLISAVLGILAGLYAGSREGSGLDRLVQGLVTFGYALPGFWVCLLLIWVFAIGLRALPATGYVSPSVSVVSWLSSIALPVIALSIGCVAAVAQQMRAATVDLVQQDFVRTLRSRGLSRRRVLLVHVLRNASPAGLTVLALQFVGLLGGAVIVETIFALPGIGVMASRSAVVGDLPSVLGVVLITVFFVVLVNLLLDLALAWINPKVRAS